MSNSDHSNNTELSEALSSLNIGSNNEERETTNNDTDNINTVITIIICAACGKECDGDSMNTCNKCDSVQYCNAACKKKHRTKHKKKCEKRVAELYDEKLFKEPPPPEDCPICFDLCFFLHAALQYLTKSHLLHVFILSPSPSL